MPLGEAEERAKRAEKRLQSLEALVRAEIVKTEHEIEEETRFRENHPELQPALHAESRGAARALVSMCVRLEALIKGSEVDDA